MDKSQKKVNLLVLQSYMELKFTGNITITIQRRFNQAYIEPRSYLHPLPQHQGFPVL
jgi:hypothetical protein